MNSNVKSAVRTLRILELHATAEGPLSLAETAATLGIPKSSAHMLVGTLTAEGYLEDVGRGRCALPVALGEGGWLGGPTVALVRAAGPEMDRLLERFQETVVLGAPTPSGDVRIAAHRTSPLAVRYEVTSDPLIPGWGTAMGHAILSHWPEEDARAYLRATERRKLTDKTVIDEDEILERLRKSRARGHSVNVDERFEGASGAAVALLDPGGRPRAAINVVTVTPRFRRRRREIVQALMDAARRIEGAAFGVPARRAAEG